MRPPRTSCLRLSAKKAIRVRMVPSLREVPELGLGAELFLQPEDRLVLEHVADVAVGVEEVAEDPRAGRAGLEARRQPPLARALNAEGALLDDPLRPRAVPEVVGI